MSNSWAGTEFFNEMDEMLATLGLWRKQIAKDPSCLYRIISEHVYGTQLKHEEIRRSCVKYIADNRPIFQNYVEGDFKQYLDNCLHPNTYGTHIEMLAFCLSYRLNFTIYQEVDKLPLNINNTDAINTMVLCFTAPSFYDIVYKKTELEDLAFCQSLAYGILYKGVFKMGESNVNLAVQKMLYDKEYSKKKKANNWIKAGKFGSGIGALKEDLPLKLDENGMEILDICGLLDQGIPPFPYKVAKALDPEIYRNVELDMWNEAKKDQLKVEQMVVPDFAPGVKCLLKLEEETTHYFHVHIQEMTDNHGPVTVYVEELGEKKTVPFDSLEPLPVPFYKALAMQSSKKTRLLSYFVAEKYQNKQNKYCRKNRNKFPILFPFLERSSSSVLRFSSQIMCPPPNPSTRICLTTNSSNLETSCRKQVPSDPVMHQTVLQSHWNLDTSETNIRSSNNEMQLAAPCLLSSLSLVNENKQQRSCHNPTSKEIKTTAFMKNECSTKTIFKDSTENLKLQQSYSSNNTNTGEVFNHMPSLTDAPPNNLPLVPTSPPIPYMDYFVGPDGCLYFPFTPPVNDFLPFLPEGQLQIPPSLINNNAVTPNMPMAPIPYYPPYPMISAGTYDGFPPNRGQGDIGSGTNEIVQANVQVQTPLSEYPIGVEGEPNQAPMGWTCNGYNGTFTYIMAPPLTQNPFYGFPEGFGTNPNILTGPQGFHPNAPMLFVVGPPPVLSNGPYVNNST